MKKILILFGCVVFYYCKAVEFYVGGTLNTISFRRDGTPSRQTTNYFEVFVKGDQWLINTTRFTITNQPPQLASVGSDGIDSYQLDKVSINAASNNFARKEFGIVSTGTFPASDSMIAQIVWIAFASTSFLESNTNVPLRSPLAISHQVSTNRLETRILENASLPTHLPLRIDFIDPVTSARTYHFSTTKTLKRDGLEIPSDFEFSQFYVTGPEEHEQKLHVLYQGTVTNYSSRVEIDSMLPKIDNCDVTDSRFFDRREIVYKLEHGQWLKRNDPDLIKIIDRVPIHQPPANSQLETSHVLWFRTIFLIILILPPVIVIAVSRKTRKH